MLLLEHLLSLCSSLTGLARPRTSSFVSAADTDQLGVLTGDKAVPFFQHSSLPPALLGEIWQLSDPENSGFLTPERFGVAFRLIGHAQAGGAEEVKPDWVGVGELPMVECCTSLAAKLTRPHTSTTPYCLASLQPGLFPTSKASPFLRISARVHRRPRRLLLRQQLLPALLSRFNNNRPVRVRRQACPSHPRRRLGMRSCSPTLDPSRDCSKVSL